uniref:Mini-chromosome maintenance complex-binding protein n=1 Tax=Glossina brevipalpis TaxID=37001 RepID=A0A1A9X0J6_9MUSC
MLNRLKMEEKNKLNILPETPEEFLGPQKANFEKKLEDLKIWSSIPMLNYTPLHKLKDCTLVRFRGMIQDMRDPEIYLQKYVVRNSGDASGVRTQEGKYRDILLLNQGEELDCQSSNNQHGERRTLFLISIPAINDWCLQYENGCNQKNIPQEISIEEHERMDIKKRSVSNEKEMDAVPTVSINQDLEMNKRQKMVELKKTCCPILSAEYLLNFPIPGRPSKACMIKIYENFDAFTLNTVVDVVGFLSIDPRLDATNMEVDFENASELQAQHPPPSLIPRLHAIKIHKLPHTNPLLDMRFLSPETVPQDLMTMNVDSVQKELHTLMKLCLFNDALAADYVLSHLISAVYSREFQTIGKLSINVWNLPKQALNDYVKQFYEILELILPASHYLPLSLDVLNENNFLPRKDYDSNKLVSGLLQLAPHTHLVLDETKFQEGEFKPNGVKSLESLANLINNQETKYDFCYYEIDYNVDIPVLVFSEGRSIMVPSDISLPIEIDNDSVKMIDEVMKAARHYLHQHSRLNKFRRYLTMCKLSEFIMNPVDTEMIQNDFVKMRKINSTTSCDDLHILLVLSRLLAIARGKKVLDKESWELAKTMEEQRKQRAMKLPK